MSSIDYYNDSSRYGEYQYISLEQIVNNYISGLTHNNNTFGATRDQILLTARRGLRQFYYDVLREIKAIEIELSPTLIMVLPPDFVNYVRISWVASNGQLKPMAVDNNISIAREYLQANDYALLFDNNGDVLEGTSPSYTSDVTGTPNGDINSYSFCNGNGGFQPNLDASKVFINGSYRIDKRQGIIEFGSSAESKHIVLEYISDGMFTGTEDLSDSDISVHKFAEDALISYIYNELIKGTTTNALEKRRASKEFYNLRRLARLRMNPIRKAELIQALKGGSKWIK